MCVVGDLKHISNFQAWRGWRHNLINAKCPLACHLPLPSPCWHSESYQPGCVSSPPHQVYSAIKGKWLWVYFWKFPISFGIRKSPNKKVEDPQNHLISTSLPRVPSPPYPEFLGCINRQEGNLKMFLKTPNGKGKWIVIKTEWLLLTICSYVTYGELNKKKLFLSVLKIK